MSSTMQGRPGPILKAFGLSVLAALLVLWVVAVSAAGQNEATAASSAALKEGEYLFSDLFTTDPEASRGFYNRIFGWDFGFSIDGSRGVMVITLKDRYIGNAVIVQADEGRSRWLSFFAVKDVEQTLQRVRGFGGVVPAPPRTIRRRGTFALIRDPANAAFAVTRPSSSLPLPPPGSPGTWDGGELWTADVPAMMEFYAALFGYDTTLVPAEGSEDIAFLRKDGELEATIAGIPWDNTNSEWIPFVQVEDVAATCAKVESAGGKVLVETEEGMRIGHTALIADPLGAVLGIRQIAK